ncbi:MerR family transcriptional regulator [Maritalea mediterranea]|uniref:Helix-turn-helix domain-containing protein n=1 Tax=Maritalea mediterranea TaxID=2909667 RepID=A0ABS9EAG3_9HYPH|nr:helix-turn-helix domain-containing protein [Maritalea mediterranea]MCF4098431.1 helix-turn-helix domain-containing protein [Maritalea mediterranea]
MTGKAFSIGEVSRATDVNIETIRYYERIGLMPAPDRTAGGNRQYSLEQKRQLSFIKRARNLGFSIDQIRSLLIMADENEMTCRQVSALTATHLADVQDKIKELKRLESKLQSLHQKCQSNNAPDCPMIEDLFG